MLRVSAFKAHELCLCNHSLRTISISIRAGVSSGFGAISGELVYLEKSNLHQSALVGVVDYLVYGYQAASHHTHIVLFSGIGGVNVERCLPFLYLVRG